MSNPYFKYKYDRIKKHRGHKRAIIAIARMMLTCLHHMFLKREAFNPLIRIIRLFPKKCTKNFRNSMIKMQSNGWRREALQLFLLLQ